ncbi:MAG: aminotransferase class III-fold pyridoxal phosphate-dependent enzyme [Actinomycetota bacterium]|nr:aminotransferase class III-fold pyridoxal phosphate-dependent enzyme [Actinomycetota bacterium]
MRELVQRYAGSIEQLMRAERVIPLGAQTFSKSRTQYPAGAAPLFAVRSHGCHTWDIDGHEYVDLVSSLGAVVLGYGDQEIADAVIRQLADGVTLSLSHPLEEQVATQLVDLIPCAEMVRFAKNGTDATSAAIRLARAATGRDHVIVCGYHGWQDWYIGSTSRSLGVPAATQALTHAVPYNDLAAIEELIAQLPEGIAALIMEPMTSTFPDAGYLEGVRELTRRHGIVLVFDEMLTGFRFAPGGAQEYFGVTPDLAAFGKGLANGFPLSAVMGRHDLMMLMEDIFFSGTYGGETLSLAAASIVLTRMATGEPTKMMADIGERLVLAIDEARSPESREVLEFTGHPAWAFLKWKIENPDTLNEVKTLFLQETLRRGVLVLGTHDVTTAFTDEDIAHVAKVYAQTLEIITTALDDGDVAARLECDTLVPLFTLRS